MDTPVGIVEAKRESTDVAGSIVQAKRYSRGFEVSDYMNSPAGEWEDYKLPFLFSTNGRPFLRQVAEKSGILFLDAREPTNHSRPLEAWYTPEGLKQLLEQDIQAANERLKNEPTDYLPLRDYQSEAIHRVETEIATGSREILLAMATGRRRSFDHWLHPPCCT